MNRMSRMLINSGWALVLASAWIQTAAPLAAAVAPSLGTAQNYAVLGANSIPVLGTVTCTTASINGNVGSTFSSIVNTGCTIVGTIDTPVAASVVSDFLGAYAAIDSLNPTCDGVIPTTSTVLPPGVYCSAAGTTIGAGVILTLTGSASDVWVFRVGTSGFGALTGNSFQVVMGGTALPCNVYWRTAEAATVTSSTFLGTVLAGTAVTMTGGSWFGRALATTDATVTSAAPLSFAGCAPPASITVNKDFQPNSVASVPVALSCSSGTVINTPLPASEAAPAVFTLGGADPGTTCTATETAPAGYTADMTNCAIVPLNGSCTIVNALNGNTITVNKDFLPNSGATVSVNLTCTQGTVAVTPLLASETAPAVFEVNGATGPVTCTATEAVPFGYLADQTDCLSVPLGGSCTMVNSLASAQIPSLSGWGLTVLAALIGLLGFAAIRRMAP